MAFEGEEDHAAAGLVVEAGAQSAEHQFAAPALIEAEMGRLDQVKEIAIPLVQPGLASFREQGGPSTRRHDSSSSSLGRRTRLSATRAKVTVQSSRAAPR